MILAKSDFWHMKERVYTVQYSHKYRFFQINNSFKNTNHLQHWSTSAVRERNTENQWGAENGPIYRDRMEKWLTHSWTADGLHLKNSVISVKSDLKQFHISETSNQSNIMLLVNSRVPILSSLKHTSLVLRKSSLQLSQSSYRYICMSVYVMWYSAPSSHNNRTNHRQ